MEDGSEGSEVGEGEVEVEVQVGAGAGARESKREERGQGKERKRSFRTQPTDFFRELDGELMHFGDPSSHVNTYNWRSSDCVVAYSFALPIPISLPGTTVRYNFGTNDCDIGFGVAFVTLQGTRNTIVPQARVQSHVDPVSGRFTVEEPGRVVFEWDNSYSWITPKTLAYSITVLSPGREVAEHERCLRAERALGHAQHTIERARAKVGRTQHFAEELGNSVSELTREIELRRRQLAEKQILLQEAQREVAELNMEVETNVRRIPGLCMRLLDSKVLRHVLLYGDPRVDKFHAVCKHWNALLMKPDQVLGTAGAEPESSAPGGSAADDTAAPAVKQAEGAGATNGAS